jgi:hypothetical protein
MKRTGKMETLQRMPKCCGQDMGIRMNLGRFWEIQCRTCRDTAYVKKAEIPRPQVLESR